MQNSLDVHSLLYNLLNLKQTLCTGPLLFLMRIVVDPGGEVREFVTVTLAADSGS